MSGRQGRGGAAQRWVPVDQLSELARSLLSEDLGGRDVVPAQVAERVTALAAQWTGHGFTAQTARSWADLTPACAAYLVARGVDPSALDEVIETDRSASPLTIRRAVSTGQLDVTQAYDLLTSTASRPRPAQAQPAPFSPAPPDTATDTATDPAPEPPGPAPAVFSHPAADQSVDRDHAEHRRAASQPSRSPFRP